MYGIAGLLTGRTLGGRYLIDAVIGRGGMGAVYRATDERLGRAVAVKVIGLVTSDEEEQLRLQARFHREARAAAALHHPNVVAVYDFGTDAEVGLDFLVMELLQGEDLAARLARGGVPPLPVALAILRQAARGVAAGHRAGMVHRDVKPGNLFLEVGDDPGQPRVRVLDFGIAQLPAEEGTLAQLTEYGRAPYSPAYASPEQFRGDDRITGASDVFSLGAVGYHLVTGMRPFTSADPSRVAEELQASLRALPARAPELPEPLRAALLRALALDPGERFRDAAELADALDGVAAGAGSTPRPRSRGFRPSAVSVEPHPDDHTQLLPGPPPAQRRPTPPDGAEAPSVAEALRASAAAQEGGTGVRPDPPSVAPERARGGGRLRRFLRALWSLVVTLVAVVLFVGAWGAAISGVAEEDRQLLVLGALATVLATPFAVHRLTGSRGRFGWELLGSVVGTGAAVYYVGTEGDPAITLAAVFGLQVVIAFALARLTRRRVREEGDGSDG